MDSKQPPAHLSGGCYVDVYCQDMLTARGVQRSTTVVHVEAPRDGATPAQVRAMAEALIQAVEVAQTI